VLSLPARPASAGAGERFLDPIFEVDVTHGLPFGAAVGDSGTEETLLLDLYEPRGDTADARPALVYVHGGSFSSGTRAEGVLMGNQLAERGYVVVSIDYRLYPGAFDDIDRYIKAIPAAQHDAQAAVRWLRANAATYRINPDAIGVAGTSAGGITAMNVVYRSHDPGDSGNPGFSSAVAAGVVLAGAGTEITAPAPPVLMAHGTDDTTVPYAWAKGSCDESVALGNECTLVSYPTGHGIYAFYDDWFPLAVDFLYANVAFATGPAPVETPVDPAPTSTSTTLRSATATRPSFTG
jgi:acetyl esterase/lipase